MPPLARGGATGDRHVTHAFGPGPGSPPSRGNDARGPRDRRPTGRGIRMSHAVGLASRGERDEGPPGTFEPEPGRSDGC